MDRRRCEPESGERMSKKIKNGLIVFLFLAISVFVAVTFDYTDSYVGDRFTKAVETGHFIKGEAFSLDAFLQYYDWDIVCVVLPGDSPDFKNRVGLPYSLDTDNDAVWYLVFIHENYVIAEIPIDRAFIEFPQVLDDTCFDRWSAIISIDDNDEGTNSRLRLSFTGI